MANKLISIYRACGLETHPPHKEIRPHYFNKFNSFYSFYRAFKEISDIIVVWDGPKNALYEYINDFYVEIREINKQDNEKSLIYCYDLMNKFKNQYQYLNLQEDDYLFTEDAGRTLLNGLEYFQNHFITTQDHQHRYWANNGDITGPLCQLFVHKNRHWRTAESTTGTFAMSSELFDKIKNELYYYTVRDREFFRKMINLNHRVISCVPGCSTHMVELDMSPIVDWKDLSNKIIISE